MEYVYPDYYRQFTCIGGECPDTCCAGWEIACLFPKLFSKFLISNMDDSFTLYNNVW